MVSEEITNDLLSELLNKEIKITYYEGKRTRIIFGEIVALDKYFCKIFLDKDNTIILSRSKIAKIELCYGGNLDDE